MSTPTPAPLTDEQIDAIITGWREGNRHLCHMQSEGLMDPADSDAAFDAQLAAVIARAKREAAEEIALSSVMHIWGFLSDRDDLVSSVKVALCPGKLSEVANHVIGDARERGYDVKSWTVRSLDGFLREVHAVWAVDPDMPMWHRFITPSAPWVKEATDDPR